MSRIDPEETKQWKKPADTIEALHTEYSEVSSSNRIFLGQEYQGQWR